MKKTVSQPPIKRRVSPENKHDQNLVGYIDSEINYIQNEVQEPGWTVWAIIGAVATLSWLLLDLFQNKQFILDNVLILMLVINYLGELLRDMFSADNPIPKTVSLGRGVPVPYFNTLLSGYTLNIIWEVLRRISVIYITFLFSFELGKVVSVISYIFNGSNLIVSLLLRPVYSLLTRIVKQSQSKRSTPTLLISNPDNITGTKTLGFLFAIVEGYLAWSCVQYILKNKVNIGMEDFRLSIIASAIYVLVYILTKLKTKTPILASLIEIRRSYVLGKIDTTTARKYIDIALSGLEISNTLQKQVAKVLSSIQDTENQLDEVTKKVSALKNIYEKKRNKLNDDDIVIIDSLNDTIFNQLSRYKNLVEKDAVQAKKDLTLFIRIHKQFAIVTKGNIENVLSKIDDAADHVNRKILKILNEWLKLLIAKKYPNAEQWKSGAIEELGFEVSIDK